MNQIKHVEDIPIFMHKYIGQIIDVKGDGNCKYRVVSGFLGKGKKNHTLFHQHFVKELKSHKESYTMLYKKKEHIESAYNRIQFMNLLFLVLPVRHQRKNGCIFTKWVILYQVHIIGCVLIR